MLVFLVRKTCLKGRVLVFPSNALLTLRVVELFLDTSLGDSLLILLGVAPVRRREDAEGDRDSGVKVQIDELIVQRVSLLECLSTCRKEDKKGSLASGERRGKEEDVRGRFLDSRLSNEVVYRLVVMMVVMRLGEREVVGFGLESHAR